MSGKRKILVVEDQRNWSELYEDILKDEFDLIILNNPDEAKKAIVNEDPPFHVLITDLRLIDQDKANVDGLKVLEYLKSQGVSTRTVMISGYGTLEAANTAGELSAKFIQKNKFNNQEFLEFVRNAAEDAERRRNAFVILPFGEPPPLYIQIKNILDGVIPCRCLHDIYNNKSIAQNFLEQLHSASIIISDLTGCDRDVFFQTGVADGKFKSTILLKPSNQELNSCMNLLPVVSYDENIKGMNLLREKLPKIVQGIRDGGYQSLFQKDANHAIDSDLCLFLIYKDIDSLDSYNEVFLEAANRSHMRSIQMHEVFSSFGKLEDIYHTICSARLIVADLTYPDTEIAYLIGLAFGLEKDIIFVIQKDRDDDVPGFAHWKSRFVFSKQTGIERRESIEGLAKVIKKLILSQSKKDFLLEKQSPQVLSETTWDIIDRTDVRSDRRTEITLVERNSGITIASSPVNPALTRWHKNLILFLSANPQNTNPLDLEREIHCVQDTLRESEYRQLFLFQSYPGVSPSDLQKVLLSYNPAIVHFSGHGSRGGEIVFRGEGGEPKLISAPELTALFRKFKDVVRCVVLNACFSGVQAKAIASEIDCVIGPDRAINDQAAIEFSAGFYQALGYGRNLQDAFDLGISRMRLGKYLDYTAMKIWSVKPDVDLTKIYFVPTRND